ncbi:MAG TPA: sigma-70 family RNA polymerase sigma factor [Polyangiaceae bacterium]|nr:sigma-70 family RNA polymerase sigma factor [Polyangiaceae bacterium]
MIAADSPEVLERFHAALDLVERIATQVSRALGFQVERDDLIAYGREGLLEAARRYDGARGIPFRGFANYRVRGAMYDGVRAMTSPTRRLQQKLAALEAARQTSEGEADFTLAERAPKEDAAKEASFDEHLAAVATAASLGFVSEGRRVGRDVVSSEPNAEEALGQAELVKLVAGAVDELFDDEREIVRRYYFEGQRMDEIAAALSMHKSWASRIHTRAIARLSKRLRGADG